MRARDDSPVTRRVFLRFVGAGAVVALSPLPGCTPSNPYGSPPPNSIFDDTEWRTLGALADAVLPPDDQPGGAALGAGWYINTLLTAFDYDPPAIHAGGPFSGRHPYPNATGGTASQSFPPDDFATFMPLSRVAEKAWRLRLLGSAGVPGGGPNDGVTGPVIGLRDVVKNGIAQAIQNAPEGTPIEQLTADQRTTLFGSLDKDFQQAFAELVVEAALSAPEYGGNGQLGGWNMVHIDGDTQPLGYSVWDGATSSYVERLPVSTADTGPDVDPMDDDTLKYVEIITTTLGGRTS